MCLAHLERCLRSRWKEFKLSGSGHWNNFRLELPPKGHSGRWGSSLCCLGWFKISTTLRDRLINWNCDEHIHEKLLLQLQLWAWAHLQLHKQESNEWNCMFFSCSWEKPQLNYSAAEVAVGPNEYDSIFSCLVGGVAGVTLVIKKCDFQRDITLNCKQLTRTATDIAYSADKIQ